MNLETVGGRCCSAACKLLIGLLLATPVTFAQRTQIGGTFGVGSAGDGEVSVGPYVLAGVEGCVLCGGRLGLFFEYNHWQLAGTRNNPTMLDLAGAGLRIQGKSPRVRPFFDIGIVGGREQLQKNLYLGPSESRGVGGMLLGGGATIDIGKRWYVRPQLKLAAVSEGYVTGWFGASVGYRF